MQLAIRVEGKVIGQEGLSLNTPSIEFDSTNSKVLSLRDLLTQLVKVEVQAFRDRQEERRLLHVMTGDELDFARSKGKFDFGTHSVQTVDEQVAVRVALQGFDDGLYYAFVDGEQVETLDSPVTLQVNSQIRLLRLIPLAGG